MSEPEPIGRLARHRRADAADAVLSDLFTAARTELGLAPHAFAIVALGGYGRRELSFGSDLDLVLLHTEDAAGVDALAAALWYPLWDAGYKLDHSVRTVEQAIRNAESDVRTAMSLLDSRHVAGHPELTVELRAAVTTDWRRRARKRLPELRESVRARAALVGELAHLAEPDLKEAYGGLRDAVALRALVQSWLVDVPHQVVEPARERLLDIRDALHVATGRGSDKLVADVGADVARRMDLPDREALLRDVYTAGRSLAHVSNTTWRRVDSLLSAPPRPSQRGRGLRPAGPRLQPLATGVGAIGGEVVLYPDASPETDALLGLRAAAAAAAARLPLSDSVCLRLARTAPPIPQPWPAEARRLMCALLGSGPGLPDVWEALDQAGVIDLWLPEWARVRMLPPQSPVHRFTVDRHLIETCMRVAADQQSVRRPDLLVVASLLHDIGKGPGKADADADANAGEEEDGLDSDHSKVGAPVAATVARRWGFEEPDALRIERLVRHHLLLAQLATTRDADDPATVEAAMTAVGDVDTLDMLESLTLADARATGPLASSAWRFSLITALVRRVRANLTSGVLPAPRGMEIEIPERPAGVGVRVQPEGDLARLIVAVPDRIGVLGTVAGVLALDRLAVRQASVYPAGDVGVSEWLVSGAPYIDPVLLRERIAVALRDDGGTVAGRLARRDAAMSGVHAFAPHVSLVPDASDTATVLEVRAPDRPGLLHTVARTLAAGGADVRSAHVATLGAQAVDVFYLTDPAGEPFAPAAAAALVSGVSHALTPHDPSVDDPAAEPVVAAR
jgi:[protein-PII] uridylyltransferase